MTTQQVLALLRRKLNEVDTSTSGYTDEELLAAVSDVRDAMEAQNLVGFADLSVGYEQEVPETYGISPEPTLPQGRVLALGAAVELLTALYIDKVKRGELGGSWTSGLESESTINVQKAFADSIRDLEREFDAQILIIRAPTSATRPQ
jgi:hypothetical protein